MNWKNAVDKLNAETFVLPDGWYARETVAEQLECSPDKVDDNLRPGLKSGRFIKQPYKVWSTQLGRNVMVIAYHDTALDEKGAPAGAGPDAGKLAAMHASGMSYADIGKAFGKSGDAIRSLLRRNKSTTKRI